MLLKRYVEISGIGFNITFDQGAEGMFFQTPSTLTIQVQQDPQDPLTQDAREFSEMMLTNILKAIPYANSKLEGLTLRFHSAQVQNGEYETACNMLEAAARDNAHRTYHFTLNSEDETGLHASLGISRGQTPADPMYATLSFTTNEAPEFGNTLARHILQRLHDTGVAADMVVTNFGGMTNIHCVDEVPKKFYQAYTALREICDDIQSRGFETSRDYYENLNSRFREREAQRAVLLTAEHMEDAVMTVCSNSQSLTPVPDHHRIQFARALFNRLWQETPRGTPLNTDVETYRIEQALTSLREDQTLNQINPALPEENINALAQQMRQAITTVHSRNSRRDGPNP